MPDTIHGYATGGPRPIEPNTTEWLKTTIESNNVEPHDPYLMFEISGFSGFAIVVPAKSSWKNILSQLNRVNPFEIDWIFSAEVLLNYADTGR